MSAAYLSRNRFVGPFRRAVLALPETDRRLRDQRSPTFSPIPQVDGLLSAELAEPAKVGLPLGQGVGALGHDRGGRPLGASKRGVDICIALTVLVLLLPLLLVLVAALKASNRGPVFYRHRRVGLNGSEFDCIKFRTMVENAEEVLAAVLASDPLAAEEWRRTQKLSRDPRVTLLGQALRRSSLDELPQVLNVLRGEMSCVGPRPVTSNELSRYGASSATVLKVRPGMTGLWQVSGRSSLDYDRRVSLDCEYVTQWSMWLDFKIILKTVPALLNTKQTS